MMAGPSDAEPLRRSLKKPAATRLIWSRKYLPLHGRTGTMTVGWI